MVGTLPLGDDCVPPAERQRIVALDTPDCATALLAIRVAGAEPPALIPAEFHYNPLGTVHGGVIASVLDIAMMRAVQRAVGPTSSPDRLEIKVNYLRAVTAAAGEVYGEAEIVQAGRRIATATSRLVDSRGRLYATASSTFLIASVQPPEPVQPAPAPPWVVGWSDPGPLAQAGPTMAGMEFLQAMATGALPPPPILTLLGITMGAVERGRVAMTLAAGQHLVDAGGHVYGGMLVTLLDTVMGCAVNSTLARGRGYTTVELRVNFVRAIKVGAGVILGVGQVVRAGGQVAIAEAKATGGDGEICAIASTTCLLFDAMARS